MYKSNYKSLFRCHTLVECVNYSLDSSTSKADLFLYLLDTYDILLSHADGSMIFDEDDDVPYIRLATKLEKYAFESWSKLFDRIPGPAFYGSPCWYMLQIVHGALGTLNCEPLAHVRGTPPEITY